MRVFGYISGCEPCVVGPMKKRTERYGLLQQAFVGDHFVLAGEDQVLGDDLRHADAVALASPGSRAKVGSFALVAVGSFTLRNTSLSPIAVARTTRW